MEGAPKKISSTSEKVHLADAEERSVYATQYKKLEAMDPLERLGLTSAPTPTNEEIDTAFKKEAMKYSDPAMSDLLRLIIEAREELLPKNKAEEYTANESEKQNQRANAYNEIKKAMRRGAMAYGNEVSKWVTAGVFEKITDDKTIELIRTFALGRVVEALHSGGYYSFKVEFDEWKTQGVLSVAMISKNEVIKAFVKKEIEDAKVNNRSEVPRIVREWSLVGL